MKLYTEDQVKQMIDRAHDGYDGYYDVMSPFAPIELPSDEEIMSTAYADRAVDYCQQQKQVGFEDGAKWLKNEILNQNK